MRRSPMLTAVLAAVLLLCLAPTSSANLISYVGGNPTKTTLMVMEDEAYNPVQIRDGMVPLSISPATPGSETPPWILFDNADLEGGQQYGIGLFKIRADGLVEDKVLCGIGQAAGDISYESSGDAQWSPDGSLILVHLGNGFTADEYLALLPADFAVGYGAVGGACDTDKLVPIFDLRAVGLWSAQSPTWSGDGTKIAFFSFDQADVGRLVILEKEPEGWNHREVLPQPTDLLIHWNYMYPDWQRNGNLLVFASFEQTGPNTGDEFPKWIDTETGDWDNLRDQNGEPIAGHTFTGTSPSWSPDDNHVLLSNPKGQLVLWTFDGPDGARGPASGAGEVIGKGTWADWQRDAITDCGDGVCEGGENSCSCSDDCGAPPSYEADCANGIDDDCNGLIDCEDGYCDTYPACLCELSETSCSDGVDNDCDTDIDCFDSDCDSDPFCTPEPPECSQYTDKWSCNGETACRWDNRAKKCVAN